jgi:acetyl-CoA acetyltransferase
VEVAVVDLEAALDLVVLDAHDLDPEVSGEAAGDALPEALRGDGGVRQAARSSSAPPS